MGPFGNLPFLHELDTACSSFVIASLGDFEAAGKVWKTYADESVIATGVMSAAYACDGDMKKAEEFGKKMGRATGKVAYGGGLLKDVPVFHELATAGESLGDCITGEPDNVGARWETYADDSVIGSGAMSLGAACEGDMEKAEEFGKKMGMAAAKAFLPLSRGVKTGKSLM